MVAVFDIGNTNVHVGLYENQNLSRKLVFPSKPKLPVNKIKRIINSSKLEGVAIASVVPHLTTQFGSICKQYKIIPTIISATSECGLKFRYRDPATLGADRIATVVGALSRYDRDVIVIDAGTAITVDVATRGWHHLGGIICPGMHILSEEIYRETAQLPRARIRKPKNLIGRSTEECLQSGIFNGTMAMISGLVRDIRKQERRDFLCVATGGSGKVVSANVNDVDRYDDDLSIYGIMSIYYQNVQTEKHGRIHK
jgi:type III pantothenate kinase